MNLKKVALLAEIIGGLGIIISILYLAHEVSESSDSQIIGNTLALTGRFQALHATVLENNELAHLIAKSRSDSSSLTPGEDEQVLAYVFSLLQIWEDAFTIRMLEDLPDSYWNVWNQALCDMTSEKGFADIWQRDLYRYYSASFLRVVNECFAQSGLATATVK
jgi:hypothetical protein